MKKFLMMIFLIGALGLTASAQDYVHNKKAINFLGKEIQKMNDHNGSSSNVLSGASLRLQYFTRVQALFIDAVEGDLRYSQWMDEVYNELTSNGASKQAADVSAYRDEVKELITI